MEQKNVQAQLQLEDSYVKEFQITTLKKIDQKNNLEILGQLGFRIININEKEDKFVGQIELKNNLKIKLKDEECSNIHISMIGLFTGIKSENYNKEKFEDMLKINGATTLSNLIRAYIYTITGLSGMPQIATPMVNFIDFFKNAKEFNNNKND